jgi:hypothetical protein
MKKMDVLLAVVVNPASLDTRQLAVPHALLTTDEQDKHFVLQI